MPIRQRAIPIKVVVAKLGLDGHDRGAKVIARSLRDAGMEVVYTGIFQTPDSIVRAVLEEDAQVLGISSLSGAHMEYTTEILRQLRQTGLDDVLVLVGGTIPAADAVEQAASVVEMQVAERDEVDGQGIEPRDPHRVEDWPPFDAPDPARLL
ncbi:MAG: cobalamin-dependent protein, partial [Candidatus Limnocylindrales bacterium]|nr:cobalamin-dependent protein [Candidatus Limnocylindrales bacterium]